jgi:hypothetical protein
MHLLHQLLLLHVPNLNPTVKGQRTSNDRRRPLVRIRPHRLTLPIQCRAERKELEQITTKDKQLRLRQILPRTSSLPPPKDMMSLQTRIPDLRSALDPAPLRYPKHARLRLWGNGSRRTSSLRPRDEGHLRGRIISTKSIIKLLCVC